MSNYIYIKRGYKYDRIVRYDEDGGKYDGKKYDGGGLEWARKNHWVYASPERYVYTFIEPMSGNLWTVWRSKPFSYWSFLLLEFSPLHGQLASGGAQVGIRRVGTLSW